MFAGNIESNPITSVGKNAHPVKIYILISEFSLKYPQTLTLPPSAASSASPTDLFHTGPGDEIDISPEAGAVSSARSQLWGRHFPPRALGAPPSSQVDLTHKEPPPASLQRM